MNLAKLFEVQKVLRDRINYNEPDRFNKLVLALLVELGECANEWRGFKFWSKNQEPRTSVNTCEHCNKYGMKSCCGCEGKQYKKPLLEEYVDGLHFVLELGIEIDMNYDEHVFRPFSNRLAVGAKFLDVFECVQEFSLSEDDTDWAILFQQYWGLGEMLGFTWEEIEGAYMEKNKVNHQRQEQGY